MNRKHNGHHTNIQSKKEGKDQESVRSSTTPDPGYRWEMTTSQLDIPNESQEVSPFPAGYHKIMLLCLIRFIDTVVSEL